MSITLSTLVKTVFKDKRQYGDIEDDDKRLLFFKFNQWAARKHVENANFFNKKGMDKAVAMDLWFDFFNDTLYTPSWFFPGAAPKKASQTTIEGLDEKDMQILRMAHADELEAYFNKQEQLKTPIAVTKLKKKKGSS